MKKLIVLLAMLSFSTAYSQNTFEIPKRANLIQIVCDTCKPDQLYNLMLKYTIGEGYDFESRDADIGKFSTKPVKYEKGSWVNVTYSITVIDSVINVRGFYSNDVSVNTYSRGIGTNIKATGEPSYYSALGIPRATFNRMVEYCNKFAEKYKLKILFINNE